MEIGQNNNEIKQKEKKLLGLVISSLLCKSNNLKNCFFKEYKDEIDESSFSRNEECNHYYIKINRKIINDKVNISVTFECKKCSDSKTIISDSFENEFNFECCEQNNIKFSYFISLIEENKPPSEYSIIKNEININNINNNDNISLYNLIDNDEEEDIQNKNKDVSIKIVHVHPWSYIADDNKITIIFKYYKKTEINYHIHCSKIIYFSEVVKEFIKASEIKDKIKAAFCGEKKLDGENAINELGLKDNDLVLVR